MDLTEAEDTKKSWRKHRTVQKKGLIDTDNYDVVDTHLEPDILENEVR